jgi:deoxyribose-phosphate aldolase
MDDGMLERSPNLPHLQTERNPGTPLHQDWIDDIEIDRSAIERRCESLPKRRTVKKEWQVAWLLKAITLIDLTTLAGDDTPGNVKRLCAKAKSPVRAEILAGYGVSELPIRTGAVCVYHSLVETAVAALDGSGIPVAAVSTGFPAGLTPLETRLAEIQRSVQDGAREIDVVIHRADVLTGNWQALYDEVRAMRVACGDAHMKVILATGELGTLRNVARASMAAMMAGADFIKTSTGKEPINATLPVSLVMVRAIREYRERTGYVVGYKPAGGIRTAKQSLDYMMLMKEELGRDYLEPERFRIGASALLTDIERQLEFHLTGRYSATHRHPMA